MRPRTIGARALGAPPAAMVGGRRPGSRHARRSRTRSTRSVSGARPYSLSALQQYSVCPYRFLLSAIYRLAPREEVSPLQRLDPLTKGNVFHRIQAEFLRQLREEGRLPIRTATVERGPRDDRRSRPSAWPTGACAAGPADPSRVGRRDRSDRAGSSSMGGVDGSGSRRLDSRMVRTGVWSPSDRRTR